MCKVIPLLLLSAVTFLAPLEASAAEYQILGRRLRIRNAGGEESKRTILILAGEKDTDIAALGGDPVRHGATLRLGMNAGSAGQQFVLDKSGWEALPTGYRYTSNGSGEPVKSVVLRRTPGGTALLKIVLDGRVGTESLDVVPPNPGTEAVAILQIGIFRYCTSFGGTAGGTVGSNTARLWSVRKATGQPACPQPCCNVQDLCLYDDFCEGFAGGVTALPGTVCHGTGTCAPPPATTGPCCNTFVGIPCLGGPVDPGLCFGEGIYFPDAACDPTALTCLVP